MCKTLLGRCEHERHLAAQRGTWRVLQNAKNSGHWKIERKSQSYCPCASLEAFRVVFVHEYRPSRYYFENPEYTDLCTAAEDLAWRSSYAARISGAYHRQYGHGLQPDVRALLHYELRHRDPRRA